MAGPVCHARAALAASVTNTVGPAPLPLSVGTGLQSSSTRVISMALLFYFSRTVRVTSGCMCHGTLSRHTRLARLAATLHRYMAHGRPTAPMQCTFYRSGVETRMPLQGHVVRFKGRFGVLACKCQTSVFQWLKFDCIQNEISTFRTAAVLANQRRTCYTVATPARWDTSPGIPEVPASPSKASRDGWG